MRYKFDYLDEFEFIVETYLGYESGDQMVLLMAKIRGKISCKYTFKPSVWLEMLEML
jgi:hypothetical protein